MCFYIYINLLIGGKKENVIHQRRLFPPPTDRTNGAYLCILLMVIRCRSSCLKGEENTVGVSFIAKVKETHFKFAAIYFFDRRRCRSFKGQAQVGLESFIYYLSCWKMMRPTLLFIQEFALGGCVGLGGWGGGVEGRFIDGQFSGNKGLRYLHQLVWCVCAHL